MAVALEKSINIKINGDAKGAEQAINNVDKALDDLKNKSQEINNSVNSNNEAFGHLNKSVEEVSKNFSSLNDFGGISPDWAIDFNSLSEELNKYKDNIGSTGDETNKLNIDTDLLKNTFFEVISTGKITEATITKLAGAFGISGVAVGIAREAIKLYIKYLNETIEVCEKIVKVLGTGAVNSIKELTSLSGGAIDGICDGIGLVKDTLENMIDIAQQAIDKLQEFADLGIEIEDSYFKMYTLLGSEAGNQVSDFADAYSQLLGLDASNLINNMNDIVSAVGSMGLATDGMVGAVSNLTMFSQDLSVLAGSFEKAQADLGSAISKGYVGRNSSLYPLMTKNEINQLKDLNSETERYNYLMSISSRIKGRYNDYLETEAGKVAQLNNQYNLFMNNIGQIALHIYATIAPVLTQLLKLANAVVESIMKIFNINVKSSGSNNINGVAQGIVDSMEAVSDATDKANRKVASFDDVIQISDNKDSGSNAGGISPTDLSLWDDLLEKQDKVNSKLDDLIEKVKQLFAEGKYYDAGKAIAEYINELLEGIDWDNIKDKAGKAGEALAQFLNGFIDTPELWINTGKTFAESINTAFEFLNGFVTELKWDQLGKDLINSWNSFWDTLDVDIMADTVYKTFMGIVSLAYEWVQGGGLLSLAQALSSFIISLFGNFSDDDIKKSAQTLVGIIGNIFDSLALLIDGYRDHPEIVDKLKLFITTLFTELTNNSSEWGNTLGTGLYEAFMFAMDMVSAWLEGGGFDSLVNFVTSTIKNFFGNFTEDDIDQCVDNVIGFIQNVFDNLGKVTELLQDEEIKEKIKNLITGLMEGFTENAGDWGETLNNIIMTILETARELLAHADENGLSEGIKTFLEKLDLSEILVAKLQLDWEKFVTLKWPMIWVKIESFFSFLGDQLKSGLLIIGSILSLAILGLYNYIIKPIGDIFTSIDKAIRIFWKNNVEDPIVKMLNRLWETLKKWWDNIKQWFSNLGSSIGGLGGKVSNAVGSLFKTRSANINVNEVTTYGAQIDTPAVAQFNIPKLATGGIATQSTLANIGEAGREAILPLENNTGWMDVLATKIADIINNQNNNTISGGNITIDMSGCVKNFYTRSEMLAFAEYVVDALKIYGAKIAVT